MAKAGHPQAAEIARKEINLLLGLAEQAGINDARLRHHLHLSENDLQEWLGVLRDAPLPARPALPLVLPPPRLFDIPPGSRDAAGIRLTRPG